MQGPCIAQTVSRIAMHLVLQSLTSVICNQQRLNQLNALPFLHSKYCNVTKGSTTPHLLLAKQVVLDKLCQSGEHLVEKVQVGLARLLLQLPLLHQLQLTALGSRHLCCQVLWQARNGSCKHSAELLRIEVHTLTYESCKERQKLMNSSSKHKTNIIA